MIRAVLVDDEELALISLKNLLKVFPEVKVVNTFTDDKTLQSYLKKETVDVAFLDIEMGILNGLNLAEIILSIQPNIHIVFITAHSEYAVQAFDLDSIDYLLKPVSPNRLKKTISRVMERLQISENSFSEIDERSPLVIKCFFEFQVFKNNQPLNFKTSKVKELFAYLFTHINSYIHRDLLIENLWPEQEFKKAKINLHTCVSHLRKMLTQLGYQNGILFSDQCYSLCIDNFDCDAFYFHQIASKYNKVDSTNINNIKEAIQLYTGGYLEMNGYEWANEKTVEYHRLMTSLLTKTIDYFKTADTIEALSYLQLYLKLNPYSDEIVNQTMELLISMGNRAEAIRIYQNYRKLLNDELGIEPNETLSLLYKSLINL
ncbi:hypothetical protein J27TS8_14620 [Robertmurraya siralis]|uniref:Response regulatory domain-containing protein n=1 Tax=Robertmurraya siralis TaxID=77777 RepID=A0A919WGT8_9BACI|nr:response regulator [Robertmurraya siralis]GIN61469.1 hypothetical protein J27TS8_14620 [Robertmurraya siralis]